MKFFINTLLLYFNLAIYERHYSLSYLHQFVKESFALSMGISTNLSRLLLPCKESVVLEVVSDQGSATIRAATCKLKYTA